MEVTSIWTRDHFGRDAYLAGLAFVAAQRLFELALTRRRLRALDPVERTRVADRPWTWRAMVAVHTGLIVLPACEVIVFDRRPPPLLFGAALIAFLAAQGLRTWSIQSAGVAWNARAVVPASMTVSERGPYRWIRHPTYLAVLIEFSAIPLAGGAWISWLVLNALHAPILRARIRGEERWLAELPQWRERMASKGRLWPRSLFPARRRPRAR